MFNIILSVCLLVLFYKYKQQYTKKVLYQLTRKVETTYQDIIGCESLKSDVSKFIEKNIGQLFFFVGPIGSGKKTFAKAIAGEHGLCFIENFDETNLVKIIKAHPNSIFYLNSESASMPSKIGDIAKEYSVIIIVSSNNNPELRKKYRPYKIVNFVCPSVVDKYEFFVRNNFNHNLSTILSENTNHYHYANMQQLVDDLTISGNNYTENMVYDALCKFNDMLFGYSTSTLNRTEESERRTAYHEIGHLVVAYLLKSHIKPIYITILDNPRVVYSQKSESDHTKTDCIIKIAISYASVIFEQHYMGEYSLGCGSDMKKINDIVKLMEQCDMIEKRRRLFSKEEELIERVKPIIENIILDHSDLIEKVYSELIKRKKLNALEIKELFGESLYNSIELE